MYNLSLPLWDTFALRLDSVPTWLRFKLGTYETGLGFHLQFGEMKEGLNVENYNI